MKDIITLTLFISSLVVITNLPEMITWANEFNGLWYALSISLVTILTIIGGLIVLISMIILTIFVLGLITSLVNQKKSKLL